MAFPVNSHLGVFPSMGIEGSWSHPWNSLVRSEPSALQVSSLNSNLEVEFKVRPGVLVTVDARSGDPSFEGVGLFAGYPIYDTVATFSRFGYQAWFYPDDFEDMAGTKMPLYGSVSLRMTSPFVTAYPQNIGDYIQYDCTSKYVDGDNPVVNFQRLFPVTDYQAVYSWDNPGGPGWSYFPLTGDDRTPNSPNVYVSADFPMGSDTVVSRADVRMNGVNSATDLTHANGHTAVFEYPIPACGDMDLQLEYRISLQSGATAWYPLATHHATRASNLDSNANGTLDLGDAGAFSAALGKCPGQSGYSPCFDIIEDQSDCIDIVDAGAFSQIYLMGGGKGLEESGFPVVVNGGVCASADACNPICVVSDVAWRVAIVEIEAPSGLLAWVPVDRFAGRSVLTEHPGFVGRYSLFVFGVGDPGVTELGVLHLEGAKASVSGRVRGAVVGAGAGDMADGSPQQAKALISVGVAPNPFNPSTTISLMVSSSTEGDLAVYSIAGRRVAELASGRFDAGTHQFDWDGRDDSGRLLAAGNYIYRFASAGGATVTGKLTLIK